MDSNLEQAEQNLANEFNEKLDVTATPVVPASETETFIPEAPTAPASEDSAPTETPEAPAELPVADSSAQ